MWVVFILVVCAWRAVEDEVRSGQSVLCRGLPDEDASWPRVWTLRDSWAGGVRQAGTVVYGLLKREREENSFCLKTKAEASLAQSVSVTEGVIQSALPPDISGICRGASLFLDSRIPSLGSWRAAMSPAEVTEKLGLHKMKERSWYVHPRYVILFFLTKSEADDAVALPRVRDYSRVFNGYPKTSKARLHRLTPPIFDSDLIYASCIPVSTIHDTPLFLLI
jgi:hypothetical protein